jgi:hypothetical protein
MPHTTIRDHLLWMKEQTLPPLCVEFVLRSGKSFYVKWLYRFDEEDEVITVRIWDLRALNQSDTAEMLAKMNATPERVEYERPESIHPKLDQANLRVKLSEIECIVEWHDRMWSLSEIEEEPPMRRIGF